MQRRDQQHHKILTRLSVAIGVEPQRCWATVKPYLKHLHPRLQTIATALWKEGRDQYDIATELGQTQPNISYREARLIQAIKLLRSLPLSIASTIATIEGSTLSSTHKKVLTAYLQCNNQCRTAALVGLSQATVNDSGRTAIKALRDMEPLAGETCQRLWSNHNLMNFIEGLGPKSYKRVMPPSQFVF
ncbi:MAG: hypothetical protein ACOYBP_09115 [Microbacteriaceae bacterium]